MALLLRVRRLSRWSAMVDEEGPDPSSPAGLASRVAADLAGAGVAHPALAAALLAARGAAAVLDRSLWAEQHGLTLDRLDAAEAGAIAAIDLPTALVAAAAAAWEAWEAWPPDQAS